MLNTLMPQSRINYLIDRFYNKEITTAEHEELMYLLTLEENKTTAEDFFSKAWDEFTPQYPNFLSDKSDDILNDILSNKDLNKQKSHHKYFRWTKLSIAASLFVVLSVSLYLYIKHNSDNNASGIENKPVAKADAGPGGNHAILTLSNHRKIILDDVSSGTIARQGNIAVKKAANGQLIYTVIGNTKKSKSLSVNQYNTITTPTGGQYTVVLPDGSKVWLNSESSLKFPTNFTGNERRVMLSGEAYFEVAKNKAKPFHVQSRNADVEVLGTHFNITAYADEDINKTTLLEGSVKITSGNNNCIIKPGEQATLTNNTQLKVAKTDVEEAVAWKNGYFMFANENIHDIMKKLSRWYGVKVIFENPEINETFGGTISKFKNISEVLKIIGETGTIHFKIVDTGDDKGRRVIVMK